MHVQLASHEARALVNWDRPEEARPIVQPQVAIISNTMVILICLPNAKVYDSDLERNYFILKEVIISIGFALPTGNPTLAEYEVTQLSGGLWKF